uniref:DNA topoisomerase n=1 Tax=Ciona savignyi TaxID=51511 RepID=H2Z243_CIOSA
ALVIWTDCDREGENIGFEIINICRNIKSNIPVYRARFSEITDRSIKSACNNLQQPDQRVSDAVDVRQELDLRIGAAFTRFQTLRLQKVFPNTLADKLISYGSCQFPTLGFVVERYKAREQFQPEDFWKIEVVHTITQNEADGPITSTFSWKRNRLFNELACQVLYANCLGDAGCCHGNQREHRWRPLAMDTVELEKLASRKLRINAKETMKIAESLYTQGYISYPRTETNSFPKDFNLERLVQEQTSHPDWGGFASRLLGLNGGPQPRNGHKSDQAHPPIHPTKAAPHLTGNNARIYELITRHFLACCHRDAKGQETSVEIEVGGESFSVQGLMIIERNYLEVYHYDRWNGKIIAVYEIGDQFEPTDVRMTSGRTTAPSLTEADLISLMDKHGIGTDATHAEHIETIKQRMYVGLTNDQRFLPGELGMGLVEGYDLMGYAMSRPELRAELEADLRRICDGTANKNDVLQRHISTYRSVFQEAIQKADKGGFSSRRAAPRGVGGRGVGRGGGVGGRGERGRRERTWSTGVQRGKTRNENTPMCNCSEMAVVLTVRREGPNTGRQFYKCSKQSGGCDFFLWADDRQSPLQIYLMCKCNIQAVQRTVQKDGPNKGRVFYTCDKPRAEQCGFFEWED